MDKSARGSSMRRSLAVLAVALALGMPPSAHAQSSPSPAPPMTGLIGSPSLGPAVGATDYSLLLSLDIPPSGYDVGPRVSGEAMYGFMDLAPALRLDLGGRMAFAYHSISAYSPYDAALWSMEFIPDAKLRYAVNDDLGVYGDFGLGLAFMHQGHPPAYGGDDNTVALAVQFGAGVAYAITPSMNLLGEVRFDVYTKSGAGLFVAIPTIGFEIH